MTEKTVKTYFTCDVSHMEDIKNRNIGDICFVEKYPIVIHKGNNETGHIYKKALFMCDSDLKWILVSTNLNDVSRA